VQCQRSGGAPLTTIMGWLLFRLSMMRHFFTCGLSFFNLIVMTLFLPFQSLLKEKEVIEDVHIKGVSDNHPKGVLDLEVAKIIPMVRML
jgi:hypothetical protein